MIAFLSFVATLPNQFMPLMSEADNIKFSRHKEVKGVGYKKYDNYDAIKNKLTELS